MKTTEYKGDLMGSSNPLKAIVKAIVKVVKVIVQVVEFVVKAVVNFVKGVFKGDIASIVMLIAIVFTFGAALAWWAAGLGITITTAVVSSAFTILGSEYQRQKAEKMQRAAEKDLREQAADTEAKMTAELIDKNNSHFSEMENNRYDGYQSGQFGIGSFEPDGTLPVDSGETLKDDSLASQGSNSLALVSLSLIGGYVIAGMME